MKYLNLEYDNVGLECGFTSSVYYKKDNPLLELTLNFQISFEHLDEAIHILNKPLPLSVCMKQLPPYTIVCKTQINLIFKNIFKAASLSCYITVRVKILELLNKHLLYLIKIFLKKPIIQRNCFIILKEPKGHISCGENVLFKILYPTAGKKDPFKT